MVKGFWKELKISELGEGWWKVDNNWSKLILGDWDTLVRECSFRKIHIKITDLLAISSFWLSCIKETDKSTLTQITPKEYTPIRCWREVCKIFCSFIDWPNSKKGLQYYTWQKKTIYRNFLNPNRNHPYGRTDSSCLHVVLAVGVFASKRGQNFVTSLSQ